MKDKNLVRFLLTLFLGWLGSLIINNSSLKPEGHTSRTAAYFFLNYFTLGIYGLVASFSNLSFDPAKAKNIGYIRDIGYVPQPAASEDDDGAPSAMQIVENLQVSEPVAVISDIPENSIDTNVDDSRTVDETQTAEYNGMG